MAHTLVEVVEATEIRETDIVAWVEQSWVLPVDEDGSWVFDDADVARVSLIAELRDDLGVNDEAMPVVLKLLDQVYSLRAAMAEIQEAIQTLPDSHREALQTRLREVLRQHGQD